jgi:hypothetical protein
MLQQRESLISNLGGDTLESPMCQLGAIAITRESPTLTHGAGLPSDPSSHANYKGRQGRLGQPDKAGL